MRCSLFVWQFGELFLSWLSTREWNSSTNTSQYIELNHYCPYKRSCRSIAPFRREQVWHLARVARELRRGHLAVLWSRATYRFVCSDSLNLGSFALFIFVRVDLTLVAVRQIVCIPCLSIICSWLAVAVAYAVVFIDQTRLFHCSLRHSRSHHYALRSVSRVKLHLFDIDWCWTNHRHRRHRWSRDPGVRAFQDMCERWRLRAWGGALNVGGFTSTKIQCSSRFDHLQHWFLYHMGLY